MIHSAVILESNLTKDTVDLLTAVGTNIRMIDLLVLQMISLSVVILPINDLFVVVVSVDRKHKFNFAEVEGQEEKVCK